MPSKSITVTSASTGVTDNQTFSSRGETIKCAVIRNTGSTVEIVPLNSLGTFALWGVKDTNGSTMDSIAQVYLNSTYAASSYFPGSVNRKYTTEEDRTAIHSIYSTSNEYSSMYTKIKSTRSIHDYNGNTYKGVFGGLSEFTYEESGKTGFWTAEYFSVGNYPDMGYYIVTSTGTFMEPVLDTDESYGIFTGYQAGIMPIITLKSNVTITGGSGTTSSPYTLGI